MEALHQVCLLNSDALLLAQTVSFPSINNNCKYMKCSVSFLVLPNEIHNLRVLFGNLLVLAVSSYFGVYSLLVVYSQSWLVKSSFIKPFNIENAYLRSFLATR